MTPPELTLVLEFFQSGYPPQSELTYTARRFMARIDSTSLQLYFSEPYDLLEQKDRKEFVRMFIGLICNLYELLETNDD